MDRFHLSAAVPPTSINRVRGVLSIENCSFTTVACMACYLDKMFVDAGDGRLNPSHRVRRIVEASW